VWRLVLLAAAVAAAGLVRGRIDVVEVRGRSMAPTLLPGDRLLVVRTGRPARRGEIVLAPDPREPGRELVKRVVVVDREWAVLHGDNPARSTDARTFGPVPADSLAWRVALRYWPRHRAGRVPPGPSVEDAGETAPVVSPGR
jgi:signal peptidase I